MIPLLCSFDGSDTTAEKLSRIIGVDIDESPIASTS
jgi:hypothetical protein